MTCASICNPRSKARPLPWAGLPSAAMVCACAAILLTAIPTQADQLQDEVTPQVISRAQQTLWSLQPIRKPALPQVKNDAWVTSPIDRFILAKLEAKGIAPSPKANRRALVRRAYFDLIGLPPTYEQVNAFVNDPAPLPQAFAKVVDQLLASPQFGERWGRYWLDIARYADNKGYIGVGREMRYPFSYTYRDYVIRAFNEDKPYNDFIVEQLAADRLDAAGQLKNKNDLAAMGFLTVGRRFINRTQEIIDDRIDVTTRGLMGLTVSCARCHDHKYDAVTMSDYYGLYGVFASSEEPGNLPTLASDDANPLTKRFNAEVAKRRKAMSDYKASLRNTIGHELRSRVGDYLEYIAKTAPKHKQGQVPLTGRRGELRRNAATDFQRYFASPRHKRDPVWSFWHRMIDTPRDKVAAEALRVLDELAKQGDKAINPRLAEALRKQQPKSIVDVAKVYGQLLESVYNKHKHNRAPDPADEQLRMTLYVDAAPTSVSDARVDRYRNRAERDKMRKMDSDLDRLRVTHAGAPPRAMVMVDRQSPFNPYIAIRGDINRRGERVPRRFLRVLEPIDGGQTYKGSGRLELARAIVHENNPLTARVWVSRVWQRLFGVGLVRSADDFGVRSQVPPQLDLLDYLAASFMSGEYDASGAKGQNQHFRGYSTKQLIRRVMLSSTYMQVGDTRAEADRIDPENDLWWRQNRRRLEFEPLRDAMLHVAGRLDTEMGGRPVNIFDANNTRRTIYGFIDRQNIPDLLRSFDVATPNICTPQRSNTTVPQQALFMMNGPFVTTQAKAAATNALKQTSDDKVFVSRLTALYRSILSRDPSPDEVDAARRFMSDAKSAEPSPWRFGYGPYDAGKQRVANFTPLPHFAGRSWQGGPNIPDKALQWLFLTPTGGHVGVNPQHAAIRRWVAPHDGVVRITGRLGHRTKEGDGVQGWVVSSRTGQLGHWVAHNGAQATNIAKVEVKSGDTIDFVVDCRTAHFHDSFDWSPKLTLLDASGKPTQSAWDAALDFEHASAALRPSAAQWWHVAQVLLMSNEFAFVD